jgi:Holliday junction resolvase RusA-like endonuclease
MIRYQLPYPPSVNGLFFNSAKGRGKTDGYRDWRRAAGNEIIAQGRKRIHGAASIAIYAVRPDRRKRDISNLIKAVEDLLVEMQVIEDDSLVQRLTIEWSDAGSFECMVVVQEATEALAA